MSDSDEFGLRVKSTANPVRAARIRRGQHPHHGKKLGLGTFITGTSTKYGLTDSGTSDTTVIFAAGAGAGTTVVTPIEPVKGSGVAPLARPLESYTLVANASVFVVARQALLAAAATDASTPLANWS